jgi:hypothetical protein
MLYSLTNCWMRGARTRNKILVTRQQMETALAIQKALHSHLLLELLLHPDRAVETSYFGIDEERPGLKSAYVRIWKSTSMQFVSALI